MTNHFMFMLLIYVGAQMFSMFMEGQTGIANTPLTATLSDSATTVNVVSTAGFLNANFIIIGDEDICYSSKTSTTFVVASGGRGCNDTKAIEHSNTALVYNEASGFLNRALNMQEHQVEADDGLLGTIKGRFSFIGVAGSWVSVIKQMVVFDYAYLEGLGVYIAIFYFILSAGLILRLFLMLLGR